MTQYDDFPELLTPRETAAILRTTTNTLAQNRYSRRGLPFYREGRRILYAKTDVLAHLAAGRTDQQRNTPSQPPSQWLTISAADTELDYYQADHE